MIENTTPEAGQKSPDGAPTMVLPEFVGPLDLLLHLIQKNKFSIFDIPISNVCDQYQEHLRQMKSVDLVLAGEFLWMASWLLHLKSRTLLPRVEGDGVEDDRQELVERLLEYRRVKELASVLYDSDVVRRCLWQPALGVDGLDSEPELDWEDVDLRMLARSYLEVMDRFASAHPPPLEVTPLRFKVEDKMKDLYDRVHLQKTLGLLDFLRNSVDSEESVSVIVATLELVRLGGVSADQRKVFSEIYLRPGPKAYDRDKSFSQQDVEVNHGN